MMSATYTTLNNKRVPSYNTIIENETIFHFGTKINTFLNSNFNYFNDFKFLNPNCQFLTYSSF